MKWPLLLALALYACLHPQGRKPASLEEGEGTADFSPPDGLPGRPMNDVEFAVAQRVCQSFRTKSGQLRALWRGPWLRFMIAKKPCQGQASKLIVQARSLARTDDPFGLFFDFKGEEPNSLIQTHNRGHLADICELILRGQRPENPSFWWPSEDELMELTFFLPDSRREQYQLRMGRKILGQEYQIFKVIRLKIDLRPRKDFSLGEGFVSEMVTFESCPWHNTKSWHKRIYLGD